MVSKNETLGTCHACGNLGASVKYASLDGVSRPFHAICANVAEVGDLLLELRDQIPLALAQKIAAKVNVALQESAAENQRLRGAIERALSRYDREDKGGLKVRDGLTWAMVNDLREALQPKT